MPFESVESSILGLFDRVLRRALLIDEVAVGIDFEHDVIVALLGAVALIVTLGWTNSPWWHLWVASAAGVGVGCALVEVRRRLSDASR